MQRVTTDSEPSTARRAALWRPALGGTKKRSVSHGFEKTSPGSLLCQGVTLSDPRAHGTADTRPPSPFVYRL